MSLLPKWRLNLAIVSDPALTGADKSVAAHLLDLTNASGICWPSLDLLADRTRQSKRNVIRCIERLVGAGYFAANKSRGRGRANEYRASFERAEKVTGSSSFSRPKKVTAASPIPADGEPEKVTAPSGKGDRAVPEKVTAPSPHTDQETPTKIPTKRKSARAQRNSIDEVEEYFPKFWAAYPPQRRTAKAKVKAQYRLIIESKAATVADLELGAISYAGSKDVRQGYACAPLRWLMEERWRDAPPASAPAPANGVSKPSTAADAARRKERADAAAEREQREHHERDRIAAIECSLAKLGEGAPAPGQFAAAERVLKFDRPGDTATRFSLVEKWRQALRRGERWALVTCRLAALVERTRAHRIGNVARLAIFEAAIGDAAQAEKLLQEAATKPLDPDQVDDVHDRRADFPRNVAAVIGDLLDRERIERDIDRARNNGTAGSRMEVRAARAG